MEFFKNSRHPQSTIFRYRRVYCDHRQPSISTAREARKKVNINTKAAESNNKFNNHGERSRSRACIHQLGRNFITNSAADFCSDCHAALYETFPLVGPSAKLAMQIARQATAQLFESLDGSLLECRAAAAPAAAVAQPTALATRTGGIRRMARWRAAQFLKQVVPRGTMMNNLPERLLMRRPLTQFLINVISDE